MYFSYIDIKQWIKMFMMFMFMVIKKGKMGVIALQWHQKIKMTYSINNIFSVHREDYTL